MAGMAQTDLERLGRARVIVLVEACEVRQTVPGDGVERVVAYRDRRRDEVGRQRLGLDTVVHLGRQHQERQPAPRLQWTANERHETPAIGHEGAASERQQVDRAEDQGIEQH